MKILFLAANPVDVVTRLRIDEEIREIEQKILSSPLRDQLQLVSVWAVRASDLQAVLLRHQPDIVHFSGHCSPQSGIILEDDAGNRKVVSKKALADLFRILKDNLRVVVLNACYAKDQARALTSTVDFTVGMNAAIQDKAAIVFSSHFYQSLAFGRSVEESFELAVNQLGLEGIDVTNVPELFVRDGVDATESRIGEPARLVALAEDAAPAMLISEVKSHHANAMPGIRGVAVEAQKERKPRSIAFLPWLLASIAIGLITDVLRRFLGDDGGWLQVAAAAVQLVLIALAITAAALTCISLARPNNPIVEKAAGLGAFNRPRSAVRSVILTAIALVIAIGLWLCLPVFARYYNERGVGLQYREYPDLSRARESYQQAVRLLPRYAQAHYNLALVLEDWQPDKAMEEYLLAIRYDSHIYPAYNNLSRLYILRGKNDDFESALNLLSQAGDLATQDENVQYSLNKNLGWANYALKHYAMAEVYLRRAIALRNLQSGAAAHCLLAYVLREQDKAGVIDECFCCVSLAPGEKDVEVKWVSDAQECVNKGASK